MSEFATRLDLYRLVASETARVFQAIGLRLTDAQITVPTQGDPRLCVALRPGKKVSLPSTVEIRVNDHQVLVPIEVTTDYQPYQLL